MIVTNKLAVNVAGTRTLIVSTGGFAGNVGSRIIKTGAGALTLSCATGTAFSGTLDIEGGTARASNVESQQHHFGRQ